MCLLWAKLQILCPFNVSILGFARNILHQGYIKMIFLPGFLSEHYFINEFINLFDYFC